MSIADHLRPEHVLVSVASTTKEDVIRELLDHLQEAEVVSTRMANQAYDAILERERMGSTGIGNGIAIPHVKLRTGPEAPVVAIGRSETGIEFAAIDGEKVHVVFLVLSNEGCAEEHLQILKSISMLVRDGYQHRLLLGSRTPDDFIDLFRENGG